MVIYEYYVWKFMFKVSLFLYMDIETDGVLSSFGSALGSKHE